MSLTLKIKTDINNRMKTLNRINKESIVHQAKQALQPVNRIPMIAGSILGAFVPVATYTIVHNEVTSNPALWVLATGGLIYSAMTVYSWAKTAFKHPAKALGFVVLVEGTLTFSGTVWLGFAALAILVAINAIAAGCALANDYRGK